MPWKLIAFLITLLTATLFIGFNLDNRCDVSWIFGTFRDVPIFVSLLFAFTAGVLAAIPFMIRGKRSDRTPPVPRSRDSGRTGTSAAARSKKRSPSGDLFE